MEDISRNSDAVVQTLKPLDTQNLASNRYPGQLPTVAFNNGTDGGSALASYTSSEFQDPDDSAPEGTGRKPVWTLDCCPFAERIHVCPH